MYATLSALTGVGCSNLSPAQAPTARPTPSVSAKPAASSAALTKAVVSIAIRGYLAKQYPGERVGSVSDIRTAKDSTGRWWAWGQEGPRPGSDGGAVIMSRSRDGWKAISQGSSPEVDLVAAEIRKELCPDYHP